MVTLKKLCVALFLLFLTCEPIISLDIHMNMNMNSTSNVDREQRSTLLKKELIDLLDEIDNYEETNLKDLTTHFIDFALIRISDDQFTALTDERTIGFLSSLNKFIRQYFTKESKKKSESHANVAQTDLSISNLEISSEIALICPPDQYISNGVCVCRSGSYPDPDPEKQGNCVVCHTNAARQNNKCVCLEGFYGDGVTKCDACPSNSKSVEPNRLTCQCKIGYFGDPTKNIDCVACPEYSTSSDGKTCSCITGYFSVPRRVGFLCQACPPNMILKSNNQCGCVDGYKFNGEVCERIPKFSFSQDNGFSCISGYKLVDTSCEECPASSFSENGKCVCAFGSRFSGGQCSPMCPSLKKSPKTKDCPNHCPAEPYFGGCDACTGTNTCLCDHGFGGATCDNSVTNGYYTSETAFACYSGFSKINNICSRCTTDYESSVNGVCKCNVGYKDNTNVGGCLLCPASEPFCACPSGNCIETPTGTCPENSVLNQFYQCQCKNGYFGDPLATPAVPCQLCGPHSVSSTDGKTCNCVAGYTRVGGVCTACPDNSVSSTVGTCICPLGRRLVNGQCQFCPDNSISSFSSETGGVCTCKPGFSGPSCTVQATIPENAVATKTGWICKAKYVKVGDTCQACETSDNNKVANADRTQCSCRQGYSASANNECIENPSNTIPFQNSFKCYGKYKKSEQCPENAFSYNGKCVCASGYRWNNGQCSPMCQNPKMSPNTNNCPNPNYCPTEPYTGNCEACKTTTSCSCDHGLGGPNCENEKQNGFYTSEAIFQCNSGFARNDANCDRCSDEYQYISGGLCRCNPGYQLIAGTCFLCSDEICSCPSGNCIMNSPAGTCPENSILNSNYQCQCKNGFFGDPIATPAVPCQLCGPHSVSSEDGKTCNCIDGYIRVDGVCTACPNNFVSSTVGTCICPLGRRLVNGQCQICPDNSVSSFSSETGGVCTCKPGFSGPSCTGSSTTPANAVATATGWTCNAGYTKNGGTCEVKLNPHCVACPEKAFTDPVNNDKCACSSGYYMTDLNVCEVLPANAVAKSGFGFQCENGYTLDAGVCKKCQKGTFSQNGGACTACDAGKFSAAGQSTCGTDCRVMCPENSIVSEESCVNAATVKCHCPPGTYSTLAAPFIHSSAETFCLACPAGKYSSKIDSSICLTCPENSQSKSRSSACVCRAGYFGDPHTPFGCKECAAGMYSKAGARSCTKCPPNSVSKPASAYCECERGHTGDPYSEIGCEVCPSRTYKKFIGNDACLPCDDSYNSECRCPPGFAGANCTTWINEKAYSWMSSRGDPPLFKSDVSRPFTVDVIIALVSFFGWLSIGQYVYALTAGDSGKMTYLGVKAVLFQYVYALLLSAFSAASDRHVCYIRRKAFTFLTGNGMAGLVVFFDVIYEKYGAKPKAEENDESDSSNQLNIGADDDDDGSDDSSNDNNKNQKNDDKKKSAQTKSAGKFGSNKLLSWEVTRSGVLKFLTERALWVGIIAFSSVFLIWIMLFIKCQDQIEEPLIISTENALD